MTGEELDPKDRKKDGGLEGLDEDVLVTPPSTPPGEPPPAKPVIPFERLMHDLNEDRQDR